MIDVVQAMTGKDARHAAQEVRTLCSRYPEVDQILVHFLFRGQGQRKTYVSRFEKRWEIRADFPRFTLLE